LLADSRKLAGETPGEIIERGEALLVISEAT